MVKREMKGYCRYCDKEVEGLEGYYYWKCPRCYNPIKLSFMNKVKDSWMGWKV